MTQQQQFQNINPPANEVICLLIQSEMLKKCEPYPVVGWLQRKINCGIRVIDKPRALKRPLTNKKGHSR